MHYQTSLVDQTQPSLVNEKYPGAYDAAIELTPFPEGRSNPNDTHRTKGSPNRQRVAEMCLPVDVNYVAGVPSSPHRADRLPGAEAQTNHVGVHHCSPFVHVAGCEN